MKKILLILLICAETLLVRVSAQNLSLPSFFSDNMVLQQDDSVAIWGKDKSNQKIRISTSWGEKAKAIANEKGDWRLKLKTYKTDCKSQKITIKGSDKKEINNVLIGEVWFCSGQSNMDIKVKGGLVNQPIVGSNDILIHASNYPLLRLFDGPFISSKKVCFDIPNSKWKFSESDVVNDFSALAYLYGRKLQEVLKVPVGIIRSSWGGSPVEAFMSKEALENYKNFSIFDINNKDTLPNHIPSGVYNGMIYPYVGYSIKGFIWYQGENNRPHAKEYKKLFPCMVKQWRKEWGKGDLPFYYVQIAPLRSTHQGNSAYLREAQMLDLKLIPNSGMASTLDIGDEYCIHPCRKKQVADRLALFAFKNDYGFKDIVAQGPIYKDSWLYKDNKMQVDFDYVGNGLSTFGKDLTGFEIAGEDRVFYPAKANIKWGTTTVIVFSDKVKKPVAVRYCFHSWCVPSLFNSAGLPVSSFRTDNWVDLNDDWSKY